MVFIIHLKSNGYAALQQLHFQPSFEPQLRTFAHHPAQYFAHSAMALLKVRATRPLILGTLIALL
jgi:hypothetical protein